MKTGGNSSDTFLSTYSTNGNLQQMLHEQKTDFLLLCQSFSKNKIA